MFIEHQPGFEEASQASSHLSLTGSKGVHTPYCPPSPAADMSNQCQTPLAECAIKLLVHPHKTPGGYRHPWWSTQTMKPISIRFWMDMTAAFREMRKDEARKVRGPPRSPSWEEKSKFKPGSSSCQPYSLFTNVPRFPEAPHASTLCIVPPGPRPQAENKLVMTEISAAR